MGESNKSFTHSQKRKKGKNMKKLILLFTIVCAGQLYGMEPEHKMGDFGELPKDVHNEIKMALASNDTLEETIKAIKVASVLWGARYDSLENFTKIAHRLANEFGVSTSEVADKFGTSIAKKYNELGSKLIGNLVYSDDPGAIDRIVRLIEDGADVNFGSDAFRHTPLSFINGYGFKSSVNKKIEQILINAGAKE